MNNDDSSKLKEKLECKTYECHPDKIYLIVGKYFSTYSILCIDQSIYT